MSTEETPEVELTEHEISMKILQGIHVLLAELPAKLNEHQQRINSIKFLARRLATLDALETAAAAAAAEPKNRRDRRKKKKSKEQPVPAES